VLRAVVLTQYRRVRDRQTVMEFALRAVAHWDEPCDVSGFGQRLLFRYNF